MSSTCSAVSEGSALASSARECKPSPSAKSTPTVSGSSESTGPTSRSTTTSEPCPQSTATSCAAGSPAKTSASLEQAPDLPESVQGCGGTWHEPLAWLAPDGLSWRTWQRCLVEGWTVYSQTFPRSGLMLSGIAYQLPMPVYHKPGRASGLLPTLIAGDARGSRNGTAKGRSLASGITMTDWLWVNVGHGLLDPGSAEQMMGFPPGWTDLEASETPSSPRSPNSSGERSCEQKD